jgi:hypothetical protein
VDLSWLGKNPKLGAVDGIQRRQLVGERLSGRRPGGHHNVFAGMGNVSGCHLVAVGLPHAKRTVSSHQIRVHPRRPWLVHGLAGRDGADMTQLFRVRAAAQQGNQGVMGVHPNIVSPAGSRTRRVRRRGKPEPDTRDVPPGAQLRDRSDPSWDAESISTRETVVQPRWE